MRGFAIAAFLVAASVPAHGQNEERKHFVNEYIRQLSQIVSIRAQAVKDMSPDPAGKMADCIRNGTRLALELGSNTSMMRSIKLTGEHARSPGLVAQIWDQEKGQYQAMDDLCSTMIAGPKPGVDYGPIAASAPKITANVEYLDQTLFEVSPLVFAALISDMPDKQGHMSHLILTHKERDEMVRTLNVAFPLIDAKNPKYLTGAAKLIKEMLTTKGYKMADDP